LLAALLVQLQPLGVMLLVEAWGVAAVAAAAMEAVAHGVMQHLKQQQHRHLLQ
jgi:hypothetical protein